MALALLAATAQTTLYFRQNRRLEGDSYALIFGCVTFTAASVLLFNTIPTIFMGYGHSVNLSKTLIVAANSDPLLPGDVLHLQRMILSCLTLLYTILFSVKLAYLLFFRPILERLPLMLMYWRGVLAFTVIAYTFDITALFAECLHWEANSSETFHGVFS